MHSGFPKDLNQLRRVPTQRALFRRSCLFLLFAVCFYLQPHFAAAPQVNLEQKFEGLCRDFRQKPGPATRARLLEFCKTPAAQDWAGLGYFLVGYQAFDQDQLESASHYFSLASKEKVTIADYVLFYWASSLNQQDQKKPSQEKLESLFKNYPASSLSGRARKLYWENALGLNTPQIILDSISKMADLESNPEALYYQAQALDQIGQPQSALRNYSRLHFLYPFYPEAESVAAKRARLLQEEANLTEQVPKEWRISRIEALLAAKRYRDLSKDLPPLAQADPAFSGTFRFQYWQGTAQFGTGKYYETIQTLSPWAEPPSEEAAQAGFLIAECYRKLENYSQFKAQVEKMERGFPNSHWLEEAYFSIGNFNLVKRNLEEAVFYYQKIVTQFPDGKRTKDALWRIAWQQYRQKNYQRALELFLDHLNRFRDSEYRLGAMYWSARCQELLGKTLEARALYQECIQRFPHHYYGQMAQKRLELLKQGDTPATATPAPAQSQSQENSVNAMLSSQNLVEGWPRIKAFALMQLYDLAAKELANSPAYGSSPAIDFQVARFFYLDKNFSASIQRLRRLLPNFTELAYGALPGELWQMLYPVHFQPTITQEAQHQQVDPYLVLALIRQESMFNPRAISAANAHGLMQLLPSTARKLAREAKMRRPTTSGLLNPDLNIRLGTRYLADLLKQFGGEEDKALASYNAGERRVESWLSEGGYTDEAEFVENIPFSETRNYVKIIYRNYWFYRKLYSGGNLATP
ncbi:MAG: transglycosylase SLT domain-containing protein [Terriglobia bacterium]